MLLTADETLLISCRWLPEAPEGALQHDIADNDIIDKAIRQINEYLEGKRKTFDVPVCPAGTPFRSRVWEELRRIPYGETISYAELARRIGRPRAFRAVANACGANPLPIIIPCHRVVASGGKPGGYTGGLDIKQTLLAIEKQNSPK